VALTRCLHASISNFESISDIRSVIGAPYPEVWRFDRFLYW
jgi:hypothetical protein